MAKIYSRELREVTKELDRALRKYEPMHSAHEGYAVLAEELDELKLEVWKKPKKRSDSRMRKEAAQVAAMAIRFMLDVTGKRKDDDD